MKVENIEIFNFEGAVHELADEFENFSTDSGYCYKRECIKCPYVELIGKEGTVCNSPLVNSCSKVAGKTQFIIGPKDLDTYRVILNCIPDPIFMRQIFVSMTITASRVWWKDFEAQNLGVFLPVMCSPKTANEQCTRTWAGTYADLRKITTTYLRDKALNEWNELAQIIDTFPYANELLKLKENK